MKRCLWNSLGAFLNTYLQPNDFAPSWNRIRQSFVVSVARLRKAPVPLSLINTWRWPAQLICSAVLPFTSPSSIIFANRTLFPVTSWGPLSIMTSTMTIFRPSFKLGSVQVKNLSAFQSAHSVFFPPLSFFSSFPRGCWPDSMLSDAHCFCSVASVQFQFHEIGLSGPLFAALWGLAKLVQICCRVLAQRRWY